ncbi:glycoside hydrolase family 38 C-terminal domain-containing protein [Arthrobacter sp. zg-Y1110]|uniref:alpha-mannosidase n=1 Tax=Arthrobacter sp. zg-Y1110 TaxID=2886932 RepID=UPI001D15BD79|nr:glycoside hydrolase family 38 C-terminal domain-containing protein [Arthrobacter sp. zg-Y1110]MCC3290932.1 glycosyl hydrolase-related protein [Arthrobacter sp. zg-Y1110]UWX86346.1 glycosyl hydrolase-related protein [Arthrobacter sp. zg-Y1110]
MHYDATLVEARVRRFRGERLVPALYRRTEPLDLAFWEVPDEPVPFATAVGQQFLPARHGMVWGKPWGTVWFHAEGKVPAAWAEEKDTRAELVVDLGFTAQQPGFQAEGTVYSSSGTIIKGVEPLNRAVRLDVGAGGEIDLYIEAAANPNVAQDFLFIPTPYGDKATAGDARLYRLAQIEAGLLDLPVWELQQDVEALMGLMGELPESSQRRAEILRALDRMVDAMDPDDVSGTAAVGRRILQPVLAQPAAASAHHLHAVGHAHIDSAWLWPTRETVRKVARTFSNVCDLIDENPDFVFAASSAQQYAWLKQSYPELFARVKEKVAAGNFVPVGGMWVESDTNLPGGEALVRQFVAGKGFFLREFGIDCEEVWLPDSFGYSAALPQIMAAAGARWFLTQKISWNETNRMPHHTFRWEGIDGSRIFTHFPPVDTYNSDLGGAELARAERQYAEKGNGTTSMVPFGHGDGGGGPTREMIAAARRTRSLEGSPTVELSSPRTFFEAAEAEYAEPPVWSGELYLEFHRGTYTSQARTKRGNRRSEHLLREAELWAATAAVRAGAPYPAEELRKAWETVLLQQFHDILPGTSIAWVYQEAERNYAEVAATLGTIIEAAAHELLGRGPVAAVLNASPYPVAGIAAFGAGPEPAPEKRNVSRAGDGFVLENDAVRIFVDQAGLIRSMYDKIADREVVPSGSAANLLQLHRDTPTQWDAWDIDEHYRRNTVDLVDVSALEIVDGPAGTALRIERTFNSSQVVQYLSLDSRAPRLEISTEVDWHEQKKLLKLAFPLDIHAERATSEIQFGHIHRPTHANTSWDAARFETVAHRWVHVGEPDYGVAVANDSTYGHDITRSAHSGRATTTTVRQSLLRAPVFPDPAADQGSHRMATSVVLGAGIPEAVAEGYRLNLPLRTIGGVERTTVDPLVRLDNPALVVEAVKLAEDGSGDVIVRVYEAHGTRARGTLTTDFSHNGVTETDLLERPRESSALRKSDANNTELVLRPFELVTLRFGVPGR